MSAESHPPSSDTGARAAVGVVKSLLAAYVMGDNEGLLAHVHPDSRFEFPGDPAILPWAGVYRGGEMNAFMEVVKDSLYMLDHAPHTFVPIDGSRVLVKSWERARVKATGRVFEQTLMTLVTLRDGRVVRWEEFGDTGAMQRAFRDPEPPAGMR